MDENNSFNPIPEQNAPAAQPIENAQPVQAPVEQPVYVQQPVQAPVEQPVYAQQPVQAPVQQPVYAQQPVQAPVQQPVYAQQPVQTPVQQPVYAQQPVQAPVQQPVYAQQPVQAPVQQPVYAQQPVQAPVQQPAVPANASPKKRLVALILAIVLGSVGVNQLYLGLGSKRLVMAIIATVCDALCWIPVLGVITAIASVPLWIICYIGMIKDIIATAKGQMIDGQGLLVINW